MDFKGGTQHTTRVNLAHTSKRRALGLLIAGALLHMGGAVVQHVTDTFKKTDLAFESHLRERCPPLQIGLVQSWLPYKLQCLSLCNLNISCTFFMSKGDLCELWTVKLDPSYDFAQFNAPTVPVFWNIKSIGTENQDFAIGKPVTAGSVFPGYPDPSVLTQGADCYLAMEDCFCTSASNNWLRVDLLATAFITEVVVTASVIDDVPYIMAATIRVGNTGTTSDAVAGVTPSSGITPHQRLRFPVNRNGRYVRLQLEADLNLKALCLCKIQAYL